ncbi:MAG: flagellar basal body rod protein FlgC [Pirellulales bacterium]
MSFGGIFSATDISASGLAAERLRMEVVANNIANAHSTRSASGGPFRRQDVVFASALDDAQSSDGPNGHSLSGVRVASVQEDLSELPRVYRPGHPDADKDGFVTMPNVKPANEMVDLITASRAYEANLRTLRTFREMTEQALNVLRGS